MLKNLELYIIHMLTEKRRNTKDQTRCGKHIGNKRGVEVVRYVISKCLEYALKFLFIFAAEVAIFAFMVCQI